VGRAELGGRCGQGSPGEEHQAVWPVAVTEPAGITQGVQGGGDHRLPHVLSPRSAVGYMARRQDGQVPGGVAVPADGTREEVVRHAEDDVPPGSARSCQRIERLPRRALVVRLGVGRNWEWLTSAFERPFESRTSLSSRARPGTSDRRVLDLGAELHVVEPARRRYGHVMVRPTELRLDTSSPLSTRMVTPAWTVPPAGPPTLQFIPGCACRLSTHVKK